MFFLYHHESVGGGRLGENLFRIMHCPLLADFLFCHYVQLRHSRDGGEGRSEKNILSVSGYRSQKGCMEYIEKCS